MRAHRSRTSTSLGLIPVVFLSPYGADHCRSGAPVEEQIVGKLGGTYVPYTRCWIARKSATDIEDMVTRAEAHGSRPYAADPTTRPRIAIDLLNFMLAAPHAARQRLLTRKRWFAVPEWSHA